jgi:hypothetical protein
MKVMLGIHAGLAWIAVAIGGLNVAMKLTARRNGKVFYEYEISDFLIVDRLDDNLLEKPNSTLPLSRSYSSGNRCAMRRPR